MDFDVEKLLEPKSREENESMYRTVLDQILLQWKNEASLRKVGTRPAKKIHRPSKLRVSRINNPDPELAHLYCYEVLTPVVRRLLL